ncbi:MAG TPA: superoxide dismutase [Trueperaceae bacterium]|nr:superoxide dismutase [Trueperaceae bacterium]
MAFQLPELGFAYDALEPHIDAKTMEIHYTKHHAGYTNNLNAALEKHPELADVSLEKLLRNIHSLPNHITKAVRNNGGGYANHSLFWQIINPNDKGRLSGPLLAAINDKFGSVDIFKEGFSKTAATRFGSGWAWLVVDAFGELDLYSTANQDSPFYSNHTPILGLDVWEHAYYLNYQNRRPDYISAFWNVVNWNQVEKNYEAALK